MENSNNNDLFNLNNESFVDKKLESTIDEQKFNPDAGKQTDKVYKAIIRFLPNHQDTNKSKIKKHYVFLTDPISGDKFSVDCPSTIGKKSITKDTYWKLKNSDSAKDQELAKSFSRKTGYYSIIQVIDDKIKPENNGKIMYWNFGIKVNEKIESELKPEVGTPHNPYDLLKGKLFLVDVCVKYDWNNYDSCKFVGDPVAFEIDGKPVATKEDMTAVSELLVKESPDLSRFEYKDWTEETTNKVLNVIKNTIPDGRLVEQIIGGSNSQDNASAAAAETTATPEAKTTKETAEPEVTTEGLASEEPASTETAETKTESANSLDDLYKDL